MTVAPIALDGAAVLLTGGANGLGATTARLLAEEGARLVIADIDDEAGRAVAESVGGSFVHCDVSDPAQSVAAVALTVSLYGGLDIALLNAGLALGSRMGADFDLDAYRLAMGVNLDGVVFGINAALPALKARGGGSIVVTASLAGLAATPTDPVYCANKHAVVGLVRALGPVLMRDGVSINAVCPGFADTRIVNGIRQLIAGAEIPLLEPIEVARTVRSILADDQVGQAWFVQPGRVAEPFAFRNVPGPRGPSGEPVGRIPGAPPS